MLGRLSHQLRDVVDSSEVLQLSAIVVDLIQRSATPLRNTVKKTEFYYSSNDRFEVEDQFMYYKMSKFIRVENHGSVMELN